MNQSFCLVLLLIILPFTVLGQPPDSLQVEFSSQTGTEQIETGIELSSQLTGEPQKMLALSVLLQEKLLKLQAEPLLKAKVLKAVSDAYFYNDSINKSNEYLQKAIMFAGSVPTDSSFLAAAYNDLGLNYIELDDNLNAFEYLSKSVEMFKVLNRSDDLANAMSNLATVYYAMGQYDKAIRLYDEVYQIDLANGNIKSQSSSLNNLGRMYVDWGKYETGIEYYKRSLALLDTVADREIIGIRYNNIGLAFQKMGRHRDAIEWIEKALKVDSEENNKLKIGIRQFNLATSFLALNDFKKARYYLKQAEDFFTKLGLPSRLTKVYGELGELYQKQGDLKTAESYFLRAAEMAERSGTLPEKAIAGNYLYKH
jgi:tetratricopeptide (TPR) repeat protein